MTTGKKGALLMLTLVVLWAALPMSACLLVRSAVGIPACCHGTKDCGLPMMGANGSCCQAQGDTTAVVSVLPYAHDDPTQMQSLASYPSEVKPFAVQGNGFADGLKLPPPKFPPGGAFALRI